MKNSFSRFVFAALLSAAAGVAFAGSNPMIDAESNQVSVKTGTTVGQGVEYVHSNGRNQYGEVFDNGGKTVTDKGVVSGVFDSPSIGLDGIVYTPIKGCKEVKDRDGNDLVACNTADGAVAASKKNFGGKPNEQGDCGYVLMGDDGQSMHYRKYGQEGDAGSISIECPPTDASLGAVATKENTRHSHPKGGMVCREGNRCSHAWFSNQDILSAIKSGEVGYVEDDITGIQLAFDPQDGSVYYVDTDGERFKLKVIEADDGGVRAYHPDGTELPLDSDLLNFNKISKDGKFDSGAGYRPSELEKLRKIAKGDSVDGVNSTVSKSGNITDADKGIPSGEVGIRGWCKCKEKRETSGARGDMVGIAGTIFGIGIGGDESAPMARYLYTFCRYCGKCRQPELDCPDHSYTPNIWDNQLEMQLAVTNGLRTCDYVNARKAVERKFMKIPDGQIVFPGKCTCKKPNPIQDGFHSTCVCVMCGRYYEAE